MYYAVSPTTDNLMTKAPVQLPYMVRSCCPDTALAKVVMVVIYCVIARTIQLHLTGSWYNILPLLLQGMGHMTSGISHMTSLHLLKLKGHIPTIYRSAHAISTVSTHTHHVCFLTAYQNCYLLLQPSSSPVCAALRGLIRDSNKP